MGHGNDIKRVWSGFTGNLSLFSVILLEFVLLFLVGLFFMFLGGSMSQPSLAMAAALTAIQLLVFLLVDAFFKAGFFGMTKNALQDGHTTIREFLPNAKRYWRSFFGYYLFRFFLLLVCAVPFILTYVYEVEGSLPLLAFIFMSITSLVISFFWFLWVSAEIVFNNELFLSAIKKSVRTAHTYTKKTIVTAIIVLLVALIGFLLTMTISSPLMYMEPSPTLFWLGLGAEVLMYAIVAVTLVFNTIYIFSQHARLHKKSRKSK